MAATEGIEHLLTSMLETIEWTVDNEPSEEMRQYGVYCPMGFGDYEKQERLAHGMKEDIVRKGREIGTTRVGLRIDETRCTITFYM